MTHTLTVGEVRMLAEMERKMDSGDQPHVLDKCRNRWPVSPEIMDELGLKCCQSVSDAITLAILEANIASLEARIAVDAAAKGSS